MSKQTQRNLFICPSNSRVARFYQELVSGITTYEMLAGRVLKRIKTACAFRQVEVVRDLSNILISIPIKEYQLIARYYFVWCQFRESVCNYTVLESVIEHTQTYKSRSLIWRAGFDVYEGRSDNALHFYAEALNANASVSDHIVASRGIALVKSMEGFRSSALKDLERLIPLLRHAEPLTYYDVLNSYAVELGTAGRLTEACDVIKVVMASPFAPFYPEWQETLSDLRQKHKPRSTVATSRKSEQSQEPKPVSENVLDRARVSTVIDFMKANLHRAVSRTELAGMVNLSTSYFSHVFKAETGVSPGEYLIRLRMEEACRLLRTSFLSIKQVVAEVGYNNKGNFGRSFKLRFDVSPSQYRRHALGGTPPKDE